MKYYIYKITNTINGKMYIGQHIVKKESPRQYMGKGIGIKEAYKKYGRKNFTKTILEEIDDDTLNRVKVSEREKYWIEKLNTMELNGYNRNPGGIGGCTKESAKKVLETKMKNGTYNHSESTKTKISEAHKGKKFSKEHKNNLSKNHHKKTIHTIIFEDGHTEKTLDSLKQISEKFNTNPQSLIRYSAKNKFINGIKLEGIKAENYACCKNLPPKSQFIICYDPILKEECSLKNLRQRKYRKQELYKNIIPEKQIIKSKE